MHKLILMNMGWGGGGRYLLKQPKYQMPQSKVSEGLFKPNLWANCFTGEKKLSQVFFPFCYIYIWKVIL